MQPGVVVFMSCFDEPAAMLKRSIDSVCESRYAAEKILLFIVCDGTEVGEEAVLDHLQYNGPEGQVQQYNSTGSGSKSLNAALVFAGKYKHVNGNEVSYVVVTKLGNRSEQTNHGHRGSRDSLNILLQWLGKIINTRGNALMSQLEYEL